MFKNLVAVVCGVLFLSAAHGGSPKAQIEIKPHFSINCAPGEDENRSYVNWVYNIEKVHEDNGTVTFRMLIAEGLCNTGQAYFSRLSIDNVAVSVLKRKFSFDSPRKGVIRETLTELANNVLGLELVFDKSFVFKNGPRRVYDMVVGVQVSNKGIPTKALGYRSTLGRQVHYWWKVTLTQTNGSTDLKINQ